MRSLFQFIITAKKRLSFLERIKLILFNLISLSLLILILLLFLIVFAFHFIAIILFIIIAGALIWISTKLFPLPDEKTIYSMLDDKYSTKERLISYYYLNSDQDIEKKEYIANQLNDILSNKDPQKDFQLQLNRRFKIALILLPFIWILSFFIFSKLYSTPYLKPHKKEVKLIQEFIKENKEVISPELKDAFKELAEAIEKGASEKTKQEKIANVKKELKKEKERKEKQYQKKQEEKKEKREKKIDKKQKEDKNSQKNNSSNGKKKTATK